MLLFEAVYFPDMQLNDDDDLLALGKGPLFRTFAAMKLAEGGQRPIKEQKLGGNCTALETCSADNSYINLKDASHQCHTKLLL